MLPRNKKVTCSKNTMEGYKRLFAKIENGPVYLPDLDDLELIGEKDIEMVMIYLLYVLETTPNTPENRSALCAIQEFVDTHLLILD